MCSLYSRFQQGLLSLLGKKIIFKSDTLLALEIVDTIFYGDTESIVYRKIHMFTSQSVISKLRLILQLSFCLTSETIIRVELFWLKFLLTWKRWAESMACIFLELFKKCKLRSFCILSCSLQPHKKTSTFYYLTRIMH